MGNQWHTHTLTLKNHCRQQFSSPDLNSTMDLLLPVVDFIFLFFWAQTPLTLEPLILLISFFLKAWFHIRGKAFIVLIIVWRFCFWMQTGDQWKPSFSVYLVWQCFAFFAMFVGIFEQDQDLVLVKVIFSQTFRWYLCLINRKAILVEVEHLQLVKKGFCKRMKVVFHDRCMLVWG